MFKQLCRGSKFQNSFQEKLLKMNSKLFSVVSQLKHFCLALIRSKCQNEAENKALLFVVGKTIKMLRFAIIQDRSTSGPIALHR